ncbi:MAG: alpha-galactosidase [Anaerolineae bacterium]
MTRLQSEVRYDGAAGNDAIVLRYRLQDGRFRIEPAHARFPAIANARCNVSWSGADGVQRQVTSDGGMQLVEQAVVEDAHGKGTQSRFDCRGEGELALSLLVKVYETQPFVLLRLVVTHRGAQPIHLHNLALVEAGASSGGAVRFADRPQALDFFKVGWHDWVYTGLRHASQREVRTRIGHYVGKMLFDPGAPIPNRAGEFWSSGWGILTDQKWALVAGFVSTAEQFSLLHVNCAPGDNALALMAQADGIRLDPGETFQSEWGYVQFVALPNPDPPADYVQAVAREMHARVPTHTPPIKWTHWYHHFQNITEELFLANLETIDRLRTTIPIRTVQLDDGYQSAWGDWETQNAKFPHGLDYITGRIKEKGYAAGLWFAPFIVEPRSQMAQVHPDWLVRDARGRPIRGGYFYQFFGYVLDATHPAVIEHFAHLADTIAHRWGFEFVKSDFMYAGALPGVRHDPKMTRAQALRRTLETFRRGFCEEVFWLGCGCPFGPAIGLVDAMRIGPDTAPSWDPQIWNLQWAGPLIKGEQSMASLRNNIRHTLTLGTLHRRWWWNDPDCLMVRNAETRLNENEIKSGATLIGMHGGLVVSSDDLTRIDPERIHLMALLTPILSPGAQAVDLLQRAMPELYESTMSRSWGDWRVVAVFNWSDRPASRTVQLAQLGLAERTPLHVFDFWNRTYWRQTGPEILLHGIPAHGCIVLRLCAADAQPRLVGDTLHLTQGGEIDAFEAQAGAVEIRVMDLGRRAEGELWVWLPEPPQGATCNGAPVTIRRAAPNVYALALALAGAATIRIEGNLKL